MTHPFPEKTRRIYTESYDNFRKLHPKEYKGSEKKVKYRRAYAIFRTNEDNSYGFNTNLLTGIYAPWIHERFDHNIGVENCTTIIPGIYLGAECDGLNPKIVQFIDFREVKKGEKPDSYNTGSHFAVIVHVGKKQYLIDPFWHRFAEIRKRKRHHLKLVNKDKSVVRREFKEMLEYTPEEFAAMMERMKDPAQSLDMLVAGQKLYENHRVNKSNCEIMVYYDDEKNSLTTRLYVAHYGISDKGIYCNMFLDDKGEVQSSDIRFVLGKGAKWTQLGKEKTVTRSDFSKLERIRRLMTAAPKDKGLVEAVKDLDERNHKSLMELVDEMWDKLDDKERKIIRPQVLSRTLYEARDSEYVYSKSERDRKIRNLYKKEKKLNQELWKFRSEVNMHYRNIKRMEKDEAKRLRASRDRLHKKIKKVVDEASTLLNFRDNKNKAYHRRMDMLLFAEELEGYSVEEMQKIVEKRGLDYRYGYLAMIIDFIPFALKGRGDLELKVFIDKIKDKVAARRAKRLQD